MGTEDHGAVIVAGKYALAWQVDAGAMGKVFAATQLGLDRPVAVKIMKERGAEFRQRFLVEAQSLAKLNHRNIVTIFDSGETEDGLVFIAMEYLRGRTLAEAIRKEKRLEPLRALHVATQVTRGLRAAHRQGIVHRDLKPSNVFLVDDDDDKEVAKVFDFGIAKHTAQEGGPPPGPLVTRAGFLVGTPAYMAPEQIEGQAVDARTDLYALGVVLFQMLTGRPPFVEEKAVDYLLAHLSKAPPPLARFVAGMPQALEVMVARLLAKAPSDRFASGDEVLRALGEATALIGGDSFRAHGTAAAVAETSLPWPQSPDRPAVDDLPLLEPLPPRTPAPLALPTEPLQRPAPKKIQTAPTMSRPRPRVADGGATFPRAALVAILIAAAVAAMSTQCAPDGAWAALFHRVAAPEPAASPAAAPASDAPAPAAAPAPPAADVDAGAPAAAAADDAASEDAAPKLDAAKAPPKAKAKPKPPRRAPRKAKARSHS